MGYAAAAEEILGDLPDVKWIVHGSGSGGTQAGLLAGLLALNHAARVVGVDVDAQPGRVRRDVCRLGREASALLDIASLWRDEHVEIASDWSAGAYGVTDATTEEAIRLAARCEGLALDPVYSGKAMAGLIGLARRGHFREGGPVLWIHTGGSPGIFAYPAAIARLSDEE
jgi:L-cysteate sulfo-lyase